MIKSGIVCTAFFMAFIILGSFSAFAQIRCTVQRYTTNDGISHDRTTSIVKDSEGFLWIGTWDGINRFDGHSFVSYKSYPGDLAGLKNDRIDHFKEDFAGNFWLKGVDEFYRFNKKTELFEPVPVLIKTIAYHGIKIKKTVSLKDGSILLISADRGVFYIHDTKKLKSIWMHSKNKQHLLPGDSVNFVFEDDKKRIWIGTTLGLASFSRNGGGISVLSPSVFIKNRLNYVDFSETDKEIYFSTRQGFIDIVDKATGKSALRKLPENQLNAIRHSKDLSKIYCSTLSGKLIVTNKDNFKSESFNLCPGIPILSLYEDGSRNLWLEPMSKGAIRFDVLNKKSLWFHSAKGSSNQGNFYKVFEDKWGRLWISIKGGGFGYFDQASKEIVRSYQAGDGETYSFPQTVYAVNYDHNNIMWLGTNDGIVKVILHGNSFSHGKMQPPSELELDNQVRAIFYDKSDRLWVGSRGGKLNVIKNGRTLGVVFENLPASGFKSVYAILQDQFGTVWIGTKFDGLYKADPVNGSDVRYKLSHFTKANSTLSHDDIFSLHEDIYGQIWVGTFGGGLNKIIRSKGGMYFANAHNTFKNYPREFCEKIRHISSDSKGHIWIATTDGLLILNNSAKSKRVAFFRHSKVSGDVHSLGDNDVQFVFRDSRNRMWLATSGGGICLASGNPLSKLTFRSFLKKDGLPSDYALSIAEDKSRNLWIATQNGLSSRLQNGSFVNYTETDGLTQGEFSEASASISRSGMLTFGTTKGFILFDPAMVKRSNAKLNTVLTNLQVNNFDVVVGAADSILHTNINYLDQLVLNYDQNIVSVDFSNLDLKAGARDNMFYRLVGLSDLWSSDHARRRATYTNLAPGNYRLDVSSDPDAPQTVKSLKITILPPPWRTWWAYLIYMLLSAAVICFAFYIARRLFRLSQDVEIQKRMSELKVDFFTNVSHELRTPLTLILNPIEELGRKETLSDQGKQTLKVVRQNAGRMMRFMNHWLELKQIQHGKSDLLVSFVDIVALIRRVTEFFADQSREKEVTIEIVSDVNELFVWLDTDKIDVVLFNLLSNAIKFTNPATSIRIKVEDEPKKGLCSVTIADHGPGVSPDKLERIFDLYYSDQNAFNNSTKGIGIGLAFSKELIQLHKGSISATNNEFGGLSVTLRLQHGKAHFSDAEFSEFVETSAENTPAEGHEETFTSQVQAPGTTDNSPRVLLVEDNFELRNFLSRQLGEHFKVETASDGQEGLAKAEELMPDLIISDIMMPRMSGIEMLDLLKQNSSTSHIPVVLLTAKASVESQIEALNYGADFYITKPFSNAHLLSAVNNLIDKRARKFCAIVEKRPHIELNPSEIVITSKDQDFLQRVVSFVENEMIEPDFNIDKVAEAIGMGRTTFYNKFKSLTNLSPVEFVRDIRLKRAKQYFDAGETNVSTVAYSCGFNNAKYFSTCFKERFKVSPKEYLKSERSY